MSQREENDAIKKRQRELREEGRKLSFHATKRLMEAEKRIAAKAEQNKPEPPPDQELERMRLKMEEARPSFMTDGFGLRGPQNPVSSLTIDGADGRGFGMQVPRERPLLAPIGKGETEISLINTGTGVSLASLNGSTLSIVRVNDTATITAEIVGDSLELTGIPTPGEGVFVENLGSGALTILIPTATGPPVPTDTVQAKSFDAGDGIRLPEVADTITVEWFTYEGATPDVSILNGFHTDGAAYFKTLIGDGNYAIDVEAEGADKVRIKAKVEGVGTGVPVYHDLDATAGHQIRSLVALGQAIAIGAGGGGTDPQIQVDWFYSNSDEGAGYINLVYDLNTTDGAAFRAVVVDASGGITAGLDGNAIALVLTDMPANTFKGNPSGSTAAPVNMTKTEATANLNLFTTALQGVAPASGGGAVNFLRADGTWAAPPGGALTDGDKGDITVSAAGTVWNIDAGVVGATEIADDGVTMPKIADSGASTGDVITYNGTNWAPAAPGGGTDYWITVLGATTETGTPALMRVKIKIYDTPATPPQWAIATAEGVCTPTGEEDWSIIRDVV